MASRKEPAQCYKGAQILRFVRAISLLNASDVPCLTYPQPAYSGDYVRLSPNMACPSTRKLKALSSSVLLSYRLSQKQAKEPTMKSAYV